MQIKTTMSHHLTPVRTTSIDKSTNTKCWRGRGGQGGQGGQGGRGALCAAGGNVSGCSRHETLWRSLPKRKIELPSDPAIPLLGMDPKTTKTRISEDLRTRMFKGKGFVTEL